MRSNGGRLLGVATTDKEAAAIVAQSLKRSVDSLRKPKQVSQRSKTPAKSSGLKYVSYTKSLNRYVGKVAGRTIGASTSMGLVVKAVTDVVGVEAADLKSKLTLRHGDQLSRVITLLRVYDDSSVPGDVAATLQQPRFRELLHTEPALYVLGLLGKEGPWKAALATAGSSPAGSNVSQLSSGARGGVAVWSVRYGMIVQTVREMALIDRSHWTANVGRNVSHHQGFLAVLQRFGILTKLSHSISSKGALRFGGDGVYSINELNTKIAGHLSCAEKVGLSLRRSFVPRTCFQWLAQARYLMELVGSHRLLGVSRQSPYALPWLVRAHLNAMMATGCGGLRQLELDPQTTVVEFRLACPDQGEWLAEFGSEFQSMQELQEALGYTGCPSLLSMHLCLFGDRVVQQYSSAWMKENVSLLRELRVKYQRQHGVNPHPAVLLQIAAVASGSILKKTTRWCRLSHMRQAKTADL